MAVETLTVTIGTRWWFQPALNVAMAIDAVLPEPLRSQFSDRFVSLIFKHAVWVR